MRTLLALVVVCATLLTSAPVSATDQCGEYLEAQALNREAFRRVGFWDGGLRMFRFNGLVLSCSSEWEIS